MTHPNEEILRMQDKALQAGDMEAFWGTFAPDVVFHIAGKNPFAGTYKGVEALQGTFAKWMSASDSLELETHDIVANDTHGVVLQNYRAKKGGKTLDAKSVLICHVKGGRIVEGWTFDENQAASDAFYGA